MGDNQFAFMYPLEKLTKAVLGIVGDRRDPRNRLEDAISYLGSSLGGPGEMPPPLDGEFEALLQRCSRCAGTGEGRIPATVQAMEDREVSECLEKIVMLLIEAAEHHGKRTLQ